MLKEYIEKFEKEGEVYMRVKARPGAAKSEVKDILEDETIKINISAAPEKGKANDELIKFLSKMFAVKKNNVKIISGKTDKVKLVKICLV
jgi:uncharacterized protein (TIGR00251 family)